MFLRKCQDCKYGVFYEKKSGVEYTCSKQKHKNVDWLNGKCTKFRYLQENNFTINYK